MQHEGRHRDAVLAHGTVAGLVLVRSGDPSSIAEFLVLPKYRRTGVGTAAARAVFVRHPGRWEVHEVVGHVEAVAFWRRAISTPFTETIDDTGTTQRFTIPS